MKKIEDVENAASISTLKFPAVTNQLYLQHLVNRPFHVNTVSDIQTDRRADENFRRRYSDNLDEVAMATRYPRLSSNVEKLYTPEMFVRRDYHSCKNVKDLMITMCHKADLRLLSDRGLNAPAYLIIDGFFKGQKAHDLALENDIAFDVCDRMLKTLALDVIHYEKSISVQDITSHIAKYVRLMKSETKNVLEKKYLKYSTMYQLLQFLDIPEALFENLPERTKQLPTSATIGFFMDMHKMSFFERMEDNGMPYMLAKSVLYFFAADLVNFGTSLPRWYHMRARLRLLFSNISSFFRR